MSRKNSRLQLLFASLFFLLAAGNIQASSPQSVVSTRVLPATNAVHSGTIAKVAVVAHVQAGYHINAHKPSLDYLIPTKVVFDDSPAFKVEKAVYPPGKLKKFVFLNSPISVYEGDVRVVVTLRVGHSLKPGTYLLKGKFAYQACNDRACLAPTSVPLEIHLRVVPSSVPVKAIHTGVFKQIRFD